MQYINKAKYLDLTNPLLLKSNMLKSSDLVALQTVQVAFNAKNNILPDNIQKLFIERKETSKLRNKNIFKNSKDKNN